MDAVLVEYDEDGRVRFESEDWMTPSVQERRAILHAAEQRIEELTHLKHVLEASGTRRSQRP
jgi:predicted Fe-S protein YdhL (DUF1289 family)